jgi:hypothetical protein
MILHANTSLFLWITLLIHFSMTPLSTIDALVHCPTPQTNNSVVGDGVGIDMSSERSNVSLKFENRTPSFTLRLQNSPLFYIKLQATHVEVHDRGTQEVVRWYDLTNSSMFEVRCTNASDSNNTDSPGNDFLQFTARFPDANVTVRFLMFGANSSSTTLNDWSDTVVYGNGTVMSQMQVESNNPIWYNTVAGIHMTVVTSAGSGSVLSYDTYSDTKNLRSLVLAAVTDANLEFRSANVALVNETKCSGGGAQNNTNPTSTAAAAAAANCSISTSFQTVTMAAEVDSIWVSPLKVELGVSMPACMNDDPHQQWSATYAVLFEVLEPTTYINWLAIGLGFGIGCCCCVLLCVAVVVVYRRYPYLRKAEAPPESARKDSDEKRLLK